jgi:hypothetical protein
MVNETSTHADCSTSAHHHATEENDMTTATTITRIGSTAAALVLLTGAALAGPASARDGADDNLSSVSDDGATWTTTADSATRTAADDSTLRLAVDDNPGAGRDDSTGRASSKGQARRITRGSCSAATGSKLKAKPRDGRIEVEFEVDSNVNGQRWTYRILHDGAVKASGARSTTAPSGSFSVERRLPNIAGMHTITATAKNPSTAETCQARVTI